MRKNFIIKIFIALIAFIDIAVLSAVFLLEYLSGKKMGVMRYLVFMKREFEAGWFNPAAIRIYGVILILSVVLFSSFSLHSIVKTKAREMIRSAILGAVFSCICYFLLIICGTLNLKAYYFFVIALFIMIVLQYVFLIFILFFYKTQFFR